MSHSIHSAHFADDAKQLTARVVENVPMAKDTYRVRIECPQIAKRIVPGQFIMLKLSGRDDPLLGRPLAFYDIVDDGSGEPIGMDIAYLVVGKMTSRLAECRPGQELNIWGPLGNGFPPTPARHLIIVAGGIGQTPFLALAQEYAGRRKFGHPARAVPRAERITFCYGARNKAYLAGVADFEKLGIEVRIGTDDGSAGHHGFVTDLLKQTLADTDVRTARVVCCGPEKMMEAVAEITSHVGVACEVSLETPMACGIGICFSCVTKVRQDDGQWDYRRTCVEGPVFDAAKIVW